MAGDDVPDAEVYAAQYVDDGLGEGFRVYTGHDEVYEAWEADGAEVRVYPDDEGWWMKVRYPVVEGEDAYDVMQETFDTIQEEAGTRPSLTIRDFHDGVERGYVSREADGFTVQYRDEHNYDIDISSSHLATVAGSTAGFGTWVGLGGGACGLVGAGLGGAFGLLAGPPGAVAGAAAGAEMGGMLGGAFGALLGSVDVADGLKGKGDPTITRDVADALNERIRKRRERKRLAQGVDESLLDQVNQKRALDAYMDAEGVEYDPAKAERHADLEKAEVEAAFEEIQAILFSRFENGKGVSVMKRYDTYGEAVDAVQRQVDIDPGRERPSIYRDRDALATILDALPEQDRQVVVETALERETTEAVDALLDRDYADIVEDVGPEWSLENT